MMKIVLVALMAVSMVSAQKPCEQLGYSACSNRGTECKWTGSKKTGFCSTRITGGPTPPRLQPPGGCQNVKNEPGCGTWEWCLWVNNKCVSNKPAPTPKPTNPPTNKPTKAVPTTASPTNKPTVQPTPAPTKPVNCQSKTTKSGCCGDAWSAGKPCKTNIGGQVLTGVCFWSSAQNKCLPVSG